MLIGPLVRERKKLLLEKVVSAWRGGGGGREKKTTICRKSAAVRAKGVVKVWMSAKRKRKKGMCGKGVGVVSGRFMLSCPCIIVSGS